MTSSLITIIKKKSKQTTTQTLCVADDTDWFVKNNNDVNARCAHPSILRWHKLQPAALLWVLSCPHNKLSLGACRAVHWPSNWS